MKQLDPEELYQVIADVIVEVAGIEPEEISLDSHLEDDLGIDRLLTYPRIIKIVDERLRSHGGLPLKDDSFMAELRECETLGELVDLIEVESKF